MLFSSIAIKTSIPATAPAATSGALSVSSMVLPRCYKTYIRPFTRVTVR